ncbi:C40 family peptidase [Salinimicrobium flavum]|uniref:C40 family peptidase n=1 Tax=Salinimicrobium flavum TaxID=1737065 RepID=A0ABW5IW44_9FLAO
MNNFQKSAFLALFTALALIGCKNGQEEAEKENETEIFIAEVKQEQIPDKRVALFNVEGIARDGEYVLRGESNQPEAVASLKSKLESAGINYSDSIQMLPSKDLGDKTVALVRTSVANIRSNPAHSAELATQATLGTPLKVLKQDGDWYLVQTPDAYLAWVDHGGITRLTQKELAAWKAAEKVIFLEPFGQAYEAPSAQSGTVSDVVAGNIFELTGRKNGFFEIKYPDGRTAYIPQAQAQLYEEWIKSVDQSEEDLVQTSKKLMGLPYLWGGTSPKGVDCSGFTKTIFFMNGMVIPRDASQQVHTGTVVDSLRNFENLKPGDLLFFGTPATDSTKEKVVHVGMWIGDNKFIHSSGNVHISSVDKNAEDYDDFNYQRYLRTKRLVGVDDPNLTLLKRSDLFMAAKTEKDTAAVPRM